MPQFQDEYRWSRSKRSKYVVRRSTALARLMASLATSKRGSESRQATFNRLCTFMFTAGGVYTKFLQGVLLGVPEVQTWVKSNHVDFFENVPQEELDVGKILSQELPEHAQRLRLWPEVIASGTFAQVYAGLLDLDTPIVVKAQRRTIRPSIKQDVWLLKRFARYGRPFLTSIDTDLGSVSSDFARMTLAETDYNREAGLGEALRKSLQEINPRIIVPRTYTELSTKHLLVQERIGGTSVAQLIRSGQPLTARQRQTMQEMMVAVLTLPFTTGLVHADPHPGNIRLVGDDQIALLDFGAIDDRQVDAGLYKALLRATIHAMEGTLSASEALEAYFAAYAPRLYRALEVTSQALGLPPVLDTLATFSLGSRAKMPLGDFKGSILALADINKLVNPGNRFMLRTSLQNVSYARATHTVLQTMQMMGLQPEIAAAFREISKQAETMTASVPSQQDKLSVFEAKEIAYNWLSKVVERNPFLAGELRRTFQALKPKSPHHEN